MTVTKKTSYGWAKIKFLYDYASSMSFTADYQLTGFEASKLLNRLEVDYWQSSSANDQNIVDTGTAGEETTVNYLVLYGHNLNTIGAEVTLQYSSDNFVADTNDAFTAETPGDDIVFYKEFDDIADDYFRLNITGCSAAPKISICYWGQLTELGYCVASFDPNEIQVKDEISLSRTGYVLGSFEEYIERKQKFSWLFREEKYQLLSDWIQEVRLNNFFTVWDSTEHASDVYLMRSADGKLYAPFTKGGIRRNISINLIGRVPE